MGPFELSAVVTVMIVLGLVAIFLGRPLIRSLGELLHELRRDRRDLDEGRQTLSELESAVQELRERIEHLESGLAFVERLQEGETAPRLGSAPSPPASAEGER